MENKNIENQPVMDENINDIPLDEKGGFNVEESDHESAFQAFQEKKEFKRKAIKMAGIAVIALAILGAAFAVYYRNKNAQNAAISKSKVQVEIPDNTDHVFVNDTIGVSISSKDANVNVVDDTRGLSGVSENYRIKDIAIGGGNIVLASQTEGLPLKVTDVHSEIVMSKDGKKTQVLLSWKTNKLAKSEVKYSKDGKGAERSIKEDGYGFSHALVLNSLEQSTRYLFSVNANDRSGNVASSDALAVFTGAKPVSVFDLIANQMGEIFGWAMKK